MHARQEVTISHTGPTPAAGAPAAIVPYEQRLDRDRRWALSEGSQFFEGKGSVQDALRRIAQRLHEAGVQYAIVGGMALFHHGYRRFTEDVDLLVTREGLRLIHEKLEGLGYVPPFPGGRNLRDVSSGVKVEFLIAGDFPGDGKPKPVAFPDPVDASAEFDGIRFLNLDKLIELKLAAGMTAATRLRDLSDVLELIKELNLPLEYADGLDPYVRDKFTELWRAGRRRFIRLWPRTAETVNARSLDELIERSGDVTGELKAMQEDGVFLEDDAGADNRYARLVTADARIGHKYGMADESEF